MSSLTIERAIYRSMVKVRLGYWEEDPVPLLERLLLNLGSSRCQKFTHRQLLTWPLPAQPPTVTSLVIRHTPHIGLDNPRSLPTHQGSAPSPLFQM